MPLTSEAARARVARLRHEWIEEHGPCAVCGSWDEPQVDHIDPSTKAFTVHFSEGRARREVELAKCQVLCRPCHLEKTIMERATTHCPQEHEYTPENTRHHSDGSRSCRRCQRERNRRWMQKNRSRG